MPSEIKMPQLSDTMTEGTLVKWLKKEGDKIKSGDIVAEVETDKATMEMESSETGTLAHVIVKEGEKVSVGAAIAALASSKENPADVKKQYSGSGLAASATQAPPRASTPMPAQVATPVGAAVPVTSAQRGGAITIEAAASGEVHERDDIGHGATREVAHPVPPIRGGNGHRILVSPLAKKIAADKGIDLGQLKGSGPNGRIVQQDVLSYQPAPAAPATPAKSEAAPRPPAIGTGEKQVIPMTKMRIAIASALQKSKQNIPHFYETVDIDIEDLTQLRERLNTRLEKQKIRLSIADFITKAVVYTLQKHPTLNARFNAEKNEITRYGDVNLGIAVSVPDGLIVPVLRAVNNMGLTEIRQRSADLIERARGQKLRREEQTEGTFTISSLGTFGIREFSAIINPPEVGILAVGSAEKRAVVQGDKIVARTMLTVTLSADHRVVDGAAAAGFLQTLKATMEEPGLMLV